MHEQITIGQELRSQIEDIITKNRKINLDEFKQLLKLASDLLNINWEQRAREISPENLKILRRVFWRCKNHCGIPPKLNLWMEELALLNNDAKEVETASQLAGLLEKLSTLDNRYFSNFGRYAHDFYIVLSTLELSLVDAKPHTMPFKDKDDAILYAIWRVWASEYPKIHEKIIKAQRIKGSERYRGVTNFSLVLWIQKEDDGVLEDLEDKFTKAVHRLHRRQLRAVGYFSPPTLTFHKNTDPQ